MALSSPLLRGPRFGGSGPGINTVYLGALPRCQTWAIPGNISACAQHSSAWNAFGRVASRQVVAATSPGSPDTSTVIVTASELDVGYSSVQGVRDTMEDEVQVHYNTAGHYLYAAVFDGHGGEKAAQWLAKQLHVQVENCLVGRTVAGKSGAPVSSAPKSNGNGAGSSGSSGSKGINSRDICPQQLIDSFHMADKALLEHLAAEGGEDAAQAGSTATVAVIKDDKLVVANVGDSQAILSRNGNAVTLAHYHRVYGSGPDVTSEIERVKSVGGWVDDGRVCGVLAVSRAFGDWEFKGSGLPRLLETGIERGYWDSEFAAQQSFSADPVVSTPDVTETLLTEGDEFLIVASDGLWDVLPPREAVAWARKEFRAKKDASEVAASLAGLALKRYSTDNVAVVVVDLQGSDVWTAKPQKGKQLRKGGIFGGLFRSG
ncbi:hypothetical protein Vretimale_16457 [Volvox reticuliferus]|uniref:protein-serine/threonine phosphatase n=1 Tax=Volvox reticuliferus TaxID=1737510 RepID=A0A8J4FNF4_9CHLO|nr:hypothetical protein Vretifemale_8660 [Volvox reticuliferus]GIM13322.1 hypothetical protein Vretimale_16457 [Volvox reticuliferus]